MIAHPRLEEECPISLLAHQKEHVLKIWGLLTRDQLFSFIDCSETGLGKTISTLCIAWHLQKLYGTQVMIVAPSETSLNNEDGWLAHAKAFGIEIMAVSTYPSIRSSKGCQPWLIADPEKKKNWKASKEFIEKCRKGLFLIFDEFHNLKNASITHFACAALVKAAKEHRNVCRTALLSHTPGDKPDVYPQLLRMLGVITEVKLFHYIPFTDQYEWINYGLGELARVCSRIANDQRATRLIEEAMLRISKGRATNVCKELYLEYIKNIITCAMPSPKKEFKVTMLNAFLETTGDSLDVLNDGLNLLMGAVGWDPVNQQVAPQAQWHLANIGIGLKLIERGKLLSIANYVRKESKIHPNKKFVICCGARGIEHHDILSSILFKEYAPDFYKDIIQELREKNENWKKLPKDMINVISSKLAYKVPVDRINGKVPKKERTGIIKKFQENNNNSWCLLISPGVGSESISLHDKHGGHPREMLIVPDFFFSRVIQAVGRINRVGIQSDAKTLIVYSKGAALETNILQSMLIKSRNARELMAQNQKVTYPAEFPYFIEGARDLQLEQQLNRFRNM